MSFMSNTLIFVAFTESSRVMKYKGLIGMPAFFLLLVSKKSAFQKPIAPLGFEFQSIFGLKRSFSVKAAVSPPVCWECSSAGEPDWNYQSAPTRLFYIQINL